MPAISIDVTGDHEAFGRRAGTDHLPVIHTTADWSLSSIEGGMQSGATSLIVAIPVDVEIDGAHAHVLVMAETSLNAWMMAAAALRGAHADEVDQPGWAVLSPALRALLIPRYAEAVRRVLPGDLDQEQALELAEMLVDGLSAGAPTEEDS